LKVNTFNKNPVSLAKDITWCYLKKFLEDLLRDKNSESRRGIKISSKKILTSDYCIQYSRYLAVLLRGSSLEIMLNVTIYYECIIIYLTPER